MEKNLAGANNVTSVARKRLVGNAGNVLQSLLFGLLGVAVGALVGVLVWPHVSLPSFGGSVSLEGKVSVAEGELDAALGTYTYEGTKTPVTVREAIEQTSTLDAMRNDDGTYDVPSADVVLSLARNSILLKEAERRGLSASEDDARAYAQETLGTQDISLVAANYGMSAEQTLEQLRQSALLKKLRDAVVTTTVPVEPAQPAPSEAGKEDEMNPAYAQYIFALAGSEWNAETNSWVSDDGAYRTQLRDYTVSNDGATYSAAKAAYELAYAQYATAQRQVATEWTEFVNGLLSNASVELTSLVA